MSTELLELSQRLESAAQRLARLEVREGLASPQALEPKPRQADTGAWTVDLLKGRMAQMEQRLARLEAARHE